MKKNLIICLALMLVFGFFISCRKKVEEAPPPPPPPQVKEQPKVEKVEKPAVVKEPELTEEEIFMAKSLEEINKEAPLKMIHFDFDRYFIREDAKPILEENAKWLKKFKTVKILIEGHCDERGTEEYNLALGERRANSAKEFLVNLGIDPKRISVISYGEERPVDPRSCEEAWAKNRRDHFVIVHY